MFTCGIGTSYDSGDSAARVNHATSTAKCASCNRLHAVLSRSEYQVARSIVDPCICRVQM